MLENLWAFLQDEANRAVLTWIGSGIVVVVGGLWAIFKYRSTRKPASPSVSTSHGGVAAGRDIKSKTIDTRGDGRS